MIFSTKTNSVQSFQNFTSVKIQSSLMVLPPKQDRFLVFCWLLTERQILQNLESNSASHVILAGDMRLGPTWRCLENHPVFFQWEIHRLHSRLGIVCPLFCKFRRGVRPLTLIVWVIWDFLALGYGNYSPLNRIQILHQEFRGIS